MLDLITSHLRFAARQLRHNPGFAVTAILTLAIGIGATTAIFSIFYAVLLRPLPYVHSERLMKIVPLEKRPSSGDQVADDVSYPNFRDWRDQARSFDGMASYHTAPLVLAPTAGSEARHLNAAVVSSDFFHLLGISPAAGRDFRRDDEKAKVVILSHALWVSAFGSSSAVLGQPVRLSDELFTVVGVLPEGASFPFVGSTSMDLWTTPAVDAVGKNPSTEQRGWSQLDVIARLKDGVTAEQARAEIESIERGLAARYPDSNADELAARVAPILSELTGDVRPALQILFAAVFALLLIACANVAGLLLARGSDRVPELAVRAALGASRSEIALQLLTESLLLSLAGGLAGLVLAAALLQELPRFLPRNLPRVEGVTLNFTVLLFALVVSALTGILFGLIPARKLSRLDPALALRDGDRTATAGRNRHRLHSALAVTETALGMILLVGAGLLVRSFLKLLQTDPGFNPAHVLTFRIGMSDKGYPPDSRAQFYQQLLARLDALPGAASSTAAFPLPFSGANMSISFDIKGRPSKPGDQPDGRATVIEPGFFEALQVPLLRGRTLTAQDNQEKAPPVIVINDALARKYFPNQEALGQHLQTGFDHDDNAPGRWREIVGVVANVKRLGLAEPPQPEYYVPYGQAPVAPAFVALRVKGDPSAYVNAVTGAVASLDKGMPVYRFRTLDENLAGATAQSRFQTLLLTGFASIALLLAAIGLYASLAYMVVQRTHEIGLRMALGAQRGNVLTMVLKRGVTLACIGVAIGLAFSMALTRFLGSLLYGVKPLDAVTFVSVVAVLLFVSAVASLVPAARAATLDPMRTLRDQ